MRELKISKVCADEAGKLCVFPAVTEDGFELVYRAGMGVYWDKAGGYFYHRDFSSLPLEEQYGIISKAVESELGLAVISCAP